MNILPANMRFGAGQPIKRLEDQRLLTGKGQFIDDKPEEGALWLYVLRSPHAHAGIKSVDTGDFEGLMHWTNDGATPYDMYRDVMDGSRGDRNRLRGVALGGRSRRGSEARRTRGVARGARQHRGRHELW